MNTNPDNKTNTKSDSDTGLFFGLDLTPAKITEYLDQNIVGQKMAKKLVAIAFRNRWRRQNLPADIAEDVTPKNILMIGPTGVGKTEIARKISKLTGAPFLKVEASKYTEVGYVGRDVESIIRDLTEVSFNLVRQAKLNSVKDKSLAAAYDIVLDRLVPRSNNVSYKGSESDNNTSGADVNQAESGDYAATREKFRQKLLNGELDDRSIDVEVLDKNSKSMFEVFPINVGDGMDQIKDVMNRLMPKNKVRKNLKIKDALRILEAEESEKLLDLEEVRLAAIERAENLGIVFIDEFDKIAKNSDSSMADISKEGVQRDLLPIIEGSVVNTKYGIVRTDYILFIAAGAFHVSKPSDLIPEIQGRFPIRVELEALTKDDLYLILKEPKHSLVFQYHHLLKVEGVQLNFSDEGLKKVADIAFELNSFHENIGARRLQALMEKILEDINFSADTKKGEVINITADFVVNQLSGLLKRQDLARYML